MNIQIWLHVRPNQFTIESGRETGGAQYLSRGVRFSSAFHSRSQVVQIHKGTRNDQQSHYSPEETLSEDEHKVCAILN